MSSSRRWLSPARLWTFIFGFWLLFLSGALAQFVGSPGMLQLFRLKGLLHTKEAQVEQLKNQVERLELDSELLEKNRIAQQREIRRVLSYTAEDEIIFDFSSEETPKTSNISE